MRMCLYNIKDYIRAISQAGIFLVFKPKPFGEAKGVDYAVHSKAYNVSYFVFGLLLSE